MSNTRNRLPLDNRFATPLDSDHRALTYTEQIIAFSKQGGSILFIDKATGFLTRRLQTSVDQSGGGHAFAMRSDNVLFHTSSLTPKLNRLDPTRDNVTVIATMSFPSEMYPAAPAGMDFRPSDGQLYVIGLDPIDFKARLGKMDSDTGVITHIGSMNQDEVVDALAISPVTGLAFALVKNPGGAGVTYSQADLLSVNLDTGGTTLIGDTGFDRGSSLAFDAAGDAYAVLLKREAAGTQRLVKINLGTGAGTEVGELFYEEQHPDAGSAFSIPDMTFRRLSAAASEFSFAQHGAGQDGHEFGAANVYEMAIHPHPQTFTEGSKISAVMGFANNQASTLDPNKTSVDPIVLKDGSSLVGGEIQAQRHTFIRKGSNWELQDPANRATVATTDATVTNLISLAVPTDTTIGFTVWIAARRTDADGESAYYRIDGAIDNNGGTTALVGVPEVTTIVEDTAAWDVSAVANNGASTLEIKVTPEAAKDIRWDSRLELIRITG